MSFSDDAARDPGFFQHHGIWAPGVRLFRSLSFGAKALLISAAFAIPLAVLAWSFYANLFGQIQFSDKERLGVEYTTRVLPLLDAGQRLRSISTSPSQRAEQRARIDAAVRLLDVAERELGAGLGTAKPFADLKQAQAQLPAGRTDGAAEDRFVKAAAALLVQATDGSNLTLDPDIDSYYLMDGALFRLPDLIDQAAGLRDLLADVPAGAPLTIGQAQTVGGMTVMVEFMDSNLAAGLAKTLALRPELQAGLAADDARATLRRFLDLAGTVARDRSPTVDASVLLAGGDQALAAVVGLQVRMLAQLDGLLARRVEAMQQQRALISALLGLFVPAATYLFFAFYRVMSGGLAEVQRHLRAMTAGDLTTSPQPWGSDEAARLMTELRSMQNSLREIVGQVRVASDTIVVASTEIADGARELSTRTEQASVSMQASASSMAQLDTTVRQTAGHAKEATGVAARNAEAASHGGEVMHRVQATMQGIQLASARIGDIIGVIDGIAFQTNILALNAAVEAARAGESGRGFAVVASEVRALAGRTAASAGEIKRLISDSVAQVEAGNGIVQQAGGAIGEVITTASEVRRLLDQIDSSATRQSQGMAEVGGQVQALDGSSQLNAALVEQTAEAAAALRDQAHALAQRVARFKLPSDAVAAA